jgi:hypothetical protein
MEEVFHETKRKILTHAYSSFKIKNILLLAVQVIDVKIKLEIVQIKKIYE